MATVSSRRKNREDDSLSLMDKIKAKQQQIEAGRGLWWTPAEGKNVVRIMPSWQGPSGLWYAEIVTHYDVGPNKKSVACLKCFDQECPVCHVLEQLCSSNKATDQTLASRMMGNKIYYVNAGVPNKPDGVVKPWRMGEKFFLDILSIYTNGEYGDFTHPKRGYDITFVRKGTGLQTRYSNILPTRPRPLQIEDWKLKLKNLTTFVKPYTRREIRAFLAGEELD